MRCPACLRNTLVKDSTVAFCMDTDPPAKTEFWTCQNSSCNACFSDKTLAEVNQESSKDPFVEDE